MNWISVKEPPKTDGIYQVAKSSGFAVSCAEYKSGVWYSVMYGKRKTIFITHWQPLSAPPFVTHWRPELIKCPDCKGEGDHLSENKTYYYDCHSCRGTGRLIINA